MIIDDISAASKIEKRQNFVEKLEDLENHLEDDNTSEILQSLKTVLLSYEKPEIYQEVDIELIESLINIQKKFSLEKKKKFGPDIKNILIQIKKDKSNSSFNWLLDFTDLLLVHFLPIEDPLNILSLRDLIKKYSDIMELRFALAIFILNNIRVNMDESSFQESLKIYEELDCFFHKRMKERLSDDYEDYPIYGPREKFFSRRTKAICKYALYLSRSKGYQAGITLLKTELNSDWIKRTKCGYVLNRQLIELYKLQMIEEKTPVVQNIGTQFYTHINQSPNCRIEQGKNAKCKNTISQGIVLKNSSINISEDKDAKSKTRWQKLKMILSEILFFAPIIDMIKTLLNFF